MITLFVMIVIIIGLMAGLGYSLFVIRDTSEMTSSVQRNAAQMERLASTLTASAVLLHQGTLLRAPNGAKETFDPPGTPEVDPVEYTGLPTSLIGNRNNAWNVPYGWCPIVFGENTDDVINSDIQSILSPSGSFYQTLVTNVKGQGYVYGYPSEPDLPIIDHLNPNDGIIGFVISAAPGFDSVVPDCQQIIRRDNTFIIDHTLGNNHGGTVIPVYSFTSLSTPAVNIATDPQTLETTFSQWNNGFLDDDFTILIPLADETEPQDELDTGSDTVLFNGDPTLRRIRLIGDVDEGEPYPEFPHEIRVERGVELVLHRMKVDNIILDGGALVASDAAVGELDILAGDATINDVRINLVDIRGGTLEIGDLTTIGNELHATPLTMSNGNIQAVGDGVWTIDSDPTAIAGGTPPISISGGKMVFGSILETNAIPPWSVTGHGMITIVDPDPADGNPRPLIDHDTQGSLPVEHQSVVVEPIQSPGIAEASCPVSYPYPIQGHCTASSGMLSSSQATENGWRCQWSSPTIGGVENAIPFPDDGEATAVCSISPQR